MTTSIDRELPILERLGDASQHAFTVPIKRINDREDLAFFFTSTAFRDLTKWLLQLNRAMFPAKQMNGGVDAGALTQVSAHASLHTGKIKSLLTALTDLIAQAPPDTGPRRFGNVAFRRWYELVEKGSRELAREHLEGVIDSVYLGAAHTDSPALDELNAYLLGSFGSAQRLDYGTGHELSFLAFLGCLWKLGAFETGDERAIVIDVIQSYLELVRRLILTYTLEPAGSHGVWGLDDHSFLPYIFGSAQLGPSIPSDDYSIPVPTEGSLPSAASPSSVTNKVTVAHLKESNMYFSAIQFIYDVKTGPFWEHSPVLFDISGIKDGWGKINKGMLKMYAAEVLGKFPVVQHFPFGSMFEWKTDPQAQRPQMSVHAQEQPTTMQNTDLPPTSSIGTAAPWARRGEPAQPRMQASTGMRSTRAPWAATGVPDRSGAAPPTDGANTTASAGRVHSNRAGQTAAPWARRG